ncbi:MAG TPA: DUF1565 domain-containing protein, partial [Alphaproteobacteria bacterium]|nr:DUF1565 domain-containing protein [Alphaproteobacteria bacterium]
MKPIPVLIAVALAGGSAQAASVTVSPATKTLIPGASQQFKATGGAVTWMVNGIPGGTPSLGLITAGGRYTAPILPLDFTAVEIEAESTVSPLQRGTAAVRRKAVVPELPTYAVAKSGSDANDGSKAHPWRTIQHALNTAKGGAAIEVGTGVYNELVTIRHSGSAKGFTILTAAHGAKPIIDGAGLKIPNGIYGLITLSDVSFARVQGFEIRNYVSDRANQDPIGIMVDGAGSNIQLLDNHIHDIKVTGKTPAFDALGIAVYGTRAPASLDTITIDGNELDHLVTGFSESLALSGNVQHFQVTNNRIHDNNNIG